MEQQKIIKKIGGADVMDSRDVAEMIGKSHAHLMRDIAGYIKDMKDNPKLDSPQFFIESTYISKQGKQLPCYLVTKQGCEMVANKMTGSKGTIFTAMYVTLFNKYEREHRQKDHYQIPGTYSEALQLAAIQTKKLEEQKPMVDYFKAQMHNPGLMTVTEIAKDYGWSATRMNRELAKRKVIYRKGKNWVLYQKYAGKGYCQFEGYAYDHNKGIHNNLKWTQRGKKFIYDLLAAEGILPVLEQMDLLGEE